MLRTMIVCVLGCGLAGCSGSESSPTPTGPSPVGAAAPPAAVQEIGMELRGFVMDTSYRPLPGTRVEVVDGPGAGTTAIADAEGNFVLSGSFSAATQFRATKEGHEARTQPWTCSAPGGCPGTNGARPWLGFYLNVPEPSVNIAGSYTLTFTADGACTDFPADMRTRSYRAAVTARSAEGRSTIPGFDLEVSGAAFFGHMTGFPIGVAGNRLNLWLHGGHDPAIVEDLGANIYLAFSGTAIATVAGAGVSTITAAFEGWIEHIVMPSPLPGPWYEPRGAPVSKATCESPNHRITLTKAN